MDTSDLPDRIQESSPSYDPSPELIIDELYASLNVKQQRFIDLLLTNGGNQTQAYLGAGYVCDADAAKASASQLLAHPNVRSVYEAKRHRLAALANISLERIAAELALEALHDPISLYDDTGQLKPPTQWPADLRRCVQEMTYIPGRETERNGAIERTPAHWKIKFVNRQTALELLGKYRGMFKDDKIVDNRQIVFNLSVEQDNRSLHINKDAIGGLILDAETTEEQQ